MYLSLSVPSDRIDVFRAAAAALLAAAAIISLILLISPVQELEAEINSFRLSGGGPAARSSAASAADPTPTPSPTVAVLSAPVLTAQAAEDGVELSWTTVHGATRYELLGVGQCQRLAPDWRRRPHRHNLHPHRPRRRHHLFLHHPCSQRRRRNKRMVRPGVHGDGHDTTHTPAATASQPSDSSASSAVDPTPTPSPTVTATVDSRRQRTVWNSVGPPCMALRATSHSTTPGGDSHGHNLHSYACGHGHTHSYACSLRRHKRPPGVHGYSHTPRPHPLIRLRPRSHPPVHLQPRPVNPAIPAPLLRSTRPPHRRQRLPPFLCRC